MSWRRRLTLIPLALFATACADSSPTEPPMDVEGLTPSEGLSFGPAPVRVMTRNMYLGADIAPIFAASDLDQIPALVAQALASVEQNNIAARAALMAREIALSQPDIVGLQEVALFRSQTPALPEPATEVLADYLQILLAALAIAGQEYTVAATVENTDLELPAFDPESPTSLTDVRYTDRDVVLVREGVAVSFSESGNFISRVPVPSPAGGTIPVLRGFNRITATVRGQTVHAVNTHLEPDETGPSIQEAQALELLDILSSVEMPTILLGDLNALPDGGTTNTYPTVIAGGFRDAWTASHPFGYVSGDTCCHDKNLLNPDPTLFERIDYVLIRKGNGHARIGLTWRVGHRRWERFPYGIWASDHVGVVSNIGIR